jgi:hypothetical protein
MPQKEVPPMSAFRPLRSLRAGLLAAGALLALLPLAAALALVPATAFAAAPAPVTIQTVKGVHAPTGTWSATGALTSSGTFATERFAETAHGAPDFVVTHVVYLFSDPSGAFRLDAQITERVTADPLVLVGEGRWTIVGESGAYATLQGTGTVSGTVDHHASTVTRTYQGGVHF